MSIYKPSGIVVQNMDYRFLNSNTGALASGTLLMTTIDLPSGLLVSSISWMSGATALINSASPHYWVALFDKSRNLLGQSTDNVAKAIAGTTIITDSLAAAFTTTYDGHHYVGIMVNSGGGTQPTYANFAGTSAAMGASSAAGSKFNGTADTALTTTAPNPAAAIAQVAAMPWVGVA